MGAAMRGTFVGCGQPPEKCRVSYYRQVCAIRRYHALTSFDQLHTYGAPSRLRLNDRAPAGERTVKDQAAMLNNPNGAFGYGQLPSAAHGVDVGELGAGTVTEQRLYQLIRQSKPIVDRQFEIEFLGSGGEVFAFTSG
jgi:hypothetical protein